SNVATVTITITPVQDPPVAEAGANQTVNEAATVAFDGSASYDADGDTLTYSWNFGDGGTAGGTAGGAMPTHAYADDGLYTVTLTVYDGHGNSSSDELVVTVNNVAPSAAVTGPATGVRGQTRTFTFTASDPSPVDQAGGFTYAINWGDGSPIQSVQGPPRVELDHTFTASGAFTVLVTVTDKDDAISVPTSRTIAINAAEMQGNTLAIGGTLSGDTIVIARLTAQNSSLGVIINGASQGTFTPTEQIL